MIKGFYRVHGIPIPLNELIRLLFNKAQGVQTKIWTTVPTTDDLLPNEMAWYDDGTNRRLYVNLDGTIRYVGLT